MSAPAGFPSFRFVIVHRANPGTAEIRWSLTPHAWDAADLSFSLFRSNSPTGPWEVLGEAADGRFHFIDTGVFGINVSRTYYYVVRAASKSGKGYCDSDISNPGPDYDNIATELVRKKTMYMLQKGGMPMAAFLRRTWGPKCALCFNHERMLPENPDCPSCYGTGFTGGFSNPVLMPAILNPPKETIVNAGIPYEPRQIYCELANVPLLDPRDILVDIRNNIRYTVEELSTYTRRLAIVSQVCRLNRIDENDAKYSLPLKDAQASFEGRSWDIMYRGYAGLEGVRSA